MAAANARAPAQPGAEAGTEQFFSSSAAPFSAKKLVQDLSAGRILLIVVNDVGRYNSVFTETSAALLKKKASKVLVSLSKPYNVINPKLRESFTIVDAASGMMAGPSSPGKKVFMVKSPASLNELMQTVSKFFKKNTVILFDSVAVLPVYNSEQDVMRFLHRLISNARKTGAALVLLSVPVAGSKKVKNFLMSMVDNTLEV